MKMGRSAQAWPRYIFWAVLLDFGEGGLVVTREQKMVFRAAFPLYYELSIREADGPSVKCSGAPLFPGGFNGGQWVDLSLG